MRMHLQHGSGSEACFLNAFSILVEKTLSTQNFISFLFLQFCNTQLHHICRNDELKQSTGRFLQGE